MLNSKGYKFYYPSYDIKIVEYRNAKFHEDSWISGSETPRTITFKEENESSQLSDNASLNWILKNKNNFDSNQGQLEQEIVQQDPIENKHQEPRELNLEEV